MVSTFHFTIQRYKTQEQIPTICSHTLFEYSFCSVITIQKFQKKYFLLMNADRFVIA